MLPADDDRANLIDPAILAERRAKRAEMSEERLNAALVEAQRENDRLQGRADALSGELEIARDRRDEIAGRVDGLQRELRVAHQREHGERQLRLETQDELAEARRDAVAAEDDLRGQLRDAHQRAEEVGRDLHHSRRDLDQTQGLIERHAAARARAEASAARHERRLAGVQSELDSLRERSEAEIEELQDELDRRADLQDEFAARVAGFRDALEDLRERHETDAARQQAAQAALRDVIEAAARMRVRLDQAQLLRAEAQERLAMAREQLDERDEEVTRLRGEIEAVTVEVGTLRAELGSQATRAASVLDAAEGGVRATLAEQAAAHEAALVEMRAQMHAAFEAPPGAPRGASPREAELRETVARLTGEIRRLREQAMAHADRERALGALVGEIVSTAHDVRDGYDQERGRLQATIEAERDRRHADETARLVGGLAAGPDRHDEVSLSTPPADAEAVIAGLARAADRLRSASEPLDNPVAQERPELQWEPFSPDAAPRARTAPWLTPALGALARHDAGSAAEILIALLALQGRTGRSVIYDLTIPSAGTWRVAVHDRVVDIVSEARGELDRSAAFRITGAVEDLAVLGGGGRAGVGPGSRVSGSRRRLRRLLRAGREPVGLVDAALLLDPGQALALLALADRPAGGAGRSWTVQLTTPSAQTWHAVLDGGVLHSRSGPCPSPDAVLRGSRADLVTLLGGASPPGVSVAGDRAAADGLVNLARAAQRV